MKKTFLVKRNALLSARSISWGALALALAVLMLLVRLTAPNFFLQIFTPAFRVSDAIAARSQTFFGSFKNAAALAAQNEKLTSENTALATENQALLRKAESLSALLGSSQKSVVGISAGVVARPPLCPYDTLLLAAGKSEGVVLGMEAFGAGGVPVGIVSSVLDDFSRVTLFSSSKVTTLGWVGQKNIPISILGAGGGAMKATIARSASVALGDVVFVPGPGQLPVGSVTRIDSDPSSPGVVLHIMPAINLFSLAWVELRTTGVIPSAIATSTAL